MLDHGTPRTDHPVGVLEQQRKVPLDPSRLSLMQTSPTPGATWLATPVGALSAIGGALLLSGPPRHSSPPPAPKL
ncbi:MAG: hypothetical protein DYG92_13295 [Leptolyngbya sp. PLA1]|nr:hypothetical protein [Leptolyngbya sp. PLA1]